MGNSLQKILPGRGDKKRQGFRIKDALPLVFLFFTYLGLLLEAPTERTVLWFSLWTANTLLCSFLHFFRKSRQYALEFLFSLALFIAGVAQALVLPWLKMLYFPFFLLVTLWYDGKVLLPLVVLVPFLDLSFFLRRGVELHEAAFFLTLALATGIAQLLVKTRKRRTGAEKFWKNPAGSAAEGVPDVFPEDTVISRYLETMFRPDEEIREVLGITKNTLAADSVHLFMNVGGGLRLRCTTEEAGEITPSGQGIVPASFEEKKPSLYLDVLEKKREVGYLKKEKIASLLAVPVLDGNFAFGVLVADSGRFQAFSSADQEILQTYSNQVMRILQRERVYGQIQRSFANLKVLNEESAKLLSSLKTEVIARNLIEGVHNIVPCAIVFSLARGRDFEMIGQHGIPSQEKQLFSLKGSLLDMAVKNRDLLYISDVRAYRSPVLPFKTAAFNSLVALPMLYENEVLGVLTLLAAEMNAFSTSQMECIKVLANQASISIANAKFHEEIEKLAITDGLTGLFNHRHFQEKLTQEFDRLGRFSDPLSLLLIDIDHFKKINDTYGHPAGDAVLKKVAGIIKKTARNIDVPARYGGEEFAVILPGTGSSGAMNMAERLRKAVMAATFSSDKERFTITVSAGISTKAQGMPEVKNKEEMIGRADKALYEAKRTGRNRSVLWDERIEQAR
ncbi:MAG: diguanylate cyclase [Nitrospirota bacterium]